MRAMVLVGPGEVELQTLPEPVAGPGEVVLEVEAVGICGSELHGSHDTSFRRPPLVMGHELAARTPDGRAVTVNPLIACRSCDLCAAGLENLCRRRSVLGIHRPGAFAERVAVPLDRVVDLPADADPVRASLVEPAANGVSALRLAGAAAGDTVGVVGAGPIGLLAAHVARRRGCQVAVSDIDERRLEVARAMGLGHAVPRLEGEFDVVVDAVGSAATHAASVALLRPGGTTVWVGLLSTDAGFDAQDVVRQGKRVVGSYCYSDDDFREAVDLVADVPADWVSAYPLAEGPAVFAELLDGGSPVVKAVLRP